MMNRRQFLSQTAIAGSALSLGLAAGWGPALAQSDTLSIALASRTSNGMNPQKPGIAGADNWVIYQLFNQLVKSPLGKWATRPEEFEPNLAQSWEMSDDARTFTYALREGVQFHKGYGELTADDVVFTFGRHLDASIPTLNKVLYANIETVEALDPRTVRFVLRQPDPTFNGTCASQITASILSRRAFEEKGEGYDTDPIGTGPYQFQSVDQNRGLLLTAFPEHFDGPPATPNLQVSFIADTTARTLAFASGQLDMIEGVRAPGWLQTMRQRSADTIFDATEPGSFNELHLNLTRKPLDDLRVRQAIRYAINNEQIAAAFGELATPMVGVIAPQFEGSVTKDELPPELRYDYDPQKARALLAEAGHPDGITIPCYTSQREDYATISLMIQEQLRAAGITLDMQIVDHSTFRSDNRLDRNSLQLYSSSFPPVPTQPLVQMLSAAAAVKSDGSGQDNFSHYGVAMEGIDALMAEAENEPDFDRRIAIIKEAEKKILADLPTLGIITLSYVIARNPRVDLGYEVEGGPAYWSLARARRLA
ncbi:ABC transporter substrate-binding protein [Aureimonas populi]|uniref:ABC transporter substrate-binding protein n=1 Tax=Aureimonas populi TaxID=1701758 RepID=A0ABW5CSN5_9HYPH|nr:ABC transporter substrate-binding protein [Aureimonas populi]